MPSVDSPLNAAHQHAANADDYMAQGLLIPASEEHYKAAEAFEAAYQASTEENTKRTLRMLHNEHRKAGKELQRKIEKLRQENKDPSLPQKPSKSATPTNAALPAPQHAPSPPPQVPRNLSDSQQTVDESFMLLGQRSEPGDAFNHFWKITEGMLEHLSQPVAFATAPLSPPEHNGGSDTDVDDPIAKTLSRGLDFVKAAKSRMLTRNDSSGNMSSDSDRGRAGISTFPPKPQHSDEWVDEIGSDDDMVDSFFMIPSKADPPTSVLKQENATLKAQLEKQRERSEIAERMLKQRQEQDQQLRESIMLARKEAQRAMVSSMALRPPQTPTIAGLAPSPVAPVVATPPAAVVPDIAGLKISVPPVSPSVAIAAAGRDQEAQLLRRVRELEEEIRLLRVENEKNKAMIAKYRERWEKLKESARKKKQAKATADTTNVVNDRIEEEPEAEAEAERDDLRPQKQAEVLSNID
ncbi:uncharacterized protein PHACADRAFT_256475 [Phanerochaete carnosa HHB-10118-sp]|uniref:Uncharacterized protein n=1 Tax=Phanerochaete carnosa (strain HHB-10118-sp) TaxID=650164 RepID=K5WYV0_PHACS|nr:uncharacterized protein PHACADRAFT_256475 [Phanerochaete carnosa HHB-10118-sp]EKM55682.1 hypothetical protein PHACADRAFT_256475 [Phanerochaete carnosa HHB-10118-sp]